MEFNEFREKVKEALPDFLTDDLKNAEIKDTAVNKLQGESYSGMGYRGRIIHISLMSSIHSFLQRTH